MRLTRIKETVDCGVFRDLAYHYQAQELAESDLRKLTTEEAPAGLEDRIRSALETEAPGVGRGALGWLRTHAFAAQAAAVLLVGFLFFVPIGEVPPPGPEGASVIHLVNKPLTIVDHDCDRAGRTPEQQRACRHNNHLNVLKAGEGQYFHINTDAPLGREIVLDPAQRGRFVVVNADYYPDLRTVKLISVRDAASHL